MDVVVEHLDREQDVTAGPNVTSWCHQKASTSPVEVQGALSSPGPGPACSRRRPLLTQSPSSGWGRGEARTIPALKPAWAERHQQPKRPNKASPEQILGRKTNHLGNKSPRE